MLIEKYKVSSLFPEKFKRSREKINFKKMKKIYLLTTKQDDDDDKISLLTLINHNSQTNPI